MKKYVFRVLCSVLLYFVIAIPAEVKADQVNNFDIQVKVQEDGILNITQKIEYQFDEPHHGIYATIPQEYEMEMDGEMKSYHFPVRNVKVKDFPYDTDDDDSFLIQIGDPDSYVSGIVDYEYSYDIVTRDLELADNKQMFYFNLVGNEWTVPIYHVDFSIEFPKEVQEAPYFYGTSEASLSGTPEQVDYVKEGNTIRGEYPLEITPGQAFTVLQHLPDEYFIFPDYSDLQLMMGIILCVAALIMIGLYLKFGRDYPLVPVVNFYPPEGLSSMVIGYLADDGVENKDVVSLFIYWASKGYIKITEEDDGNKIIFEKLMGIPESENVYERKIFKAVFKKKNVVKSSKLPEDYLEASTTAKTSVHKLFTGERSLYYKTSGMIQAISGIVFAVLFGGYVGINFKNYAVSGTHFVIGFVMGIVVFLLVSLILQIMLKNKAVRSKVNILVKGIVGSILIFVILLFFGTILYLYGQVTPTSMFLAMGALLVSVVCMLFMSKRSEYGMKLYGDVLGFREFIVQAKKDQLEALVEQNPSYFYDILPYAYVLGVSNKWIKQFEHIQVEQPNWYVTSSPMTNILFFHAMTHSLDRVNTTVTAMNVQSKGAGAFSSGGGGGGGFSGGGFGGGGGGSW